MYRRGGKRCVDLVLAVPMAMILAPLYVLVAVGVLCDVGRPILFRQARPGLHGHPFVMIKFRTMTEAPGSDAERLTRFGRWLRRTSLDELPELWNVLRGDMSLVGPRPLLVQYLERYTGEQARRHDVRPGVTGWAQVNGRNAVTWPERLALDVWYVDNVSFLFDMRVLLRTVGAVLGGRGVRARGHATMPEFLGGETGATPETGSVRRPSSS